MYRVGNDTGKNMKPSGTIWILKVLLKASNMKSKKRGTDLMHFNLSIDSSFIFLLYFFLTWLITVFFLNRRPWHTREKLIQVKCVNSVKNRVKSFTVARVSKYAIIDVINNTFYRNRNKSDVSYFFFNSFALHNHVKAFHEGLWQYLNAVKYSEYINSKRGKKRSVYNDWTFKVSRIGVEKIKN